MIEADLAYTWTLRVCAVGLFVEALELFARRRAYDEGGLFSWSILRRRFDGARRLQRAADVLCAGSARPLAVLLLRIVSLAVVLGSPLRSAPFAAGLSALVLTQLYLFVRWGGFGVSAAEQLNLIILGTAWLCTVFAPRTPALGIGFIAAQSCLSYLVNGAAKLAAPLWRSGQAFSLVAATETYGSESLDRAMRGRPHLARLLCWMVIVWECAFPLVLVAPPLARAALLVSGVLFHALVAATMGVNLFVWSYVATYPCLYWVAQRLTGE